MAMRNKKSIVVIGEGITEHYYFSRLRDARRSCAFNICPTLPKHSDIATMLRLAEVKYSEGYDYIVIVIDLDHINETGREREFNMYMSHKKALEKQSKAFIFVETMPCTEFWFLLHFWTKMQTPTYASYSQMSAELHKVWPAYDKSDKFFRSVDIFQHLMTHGNIDKALNFARQLSNIREHDPSLAFSFTQMFKMFDLLDKLEE